MGLAAEIDRDPLYFGNVILGRRRWARQSEIRLATERHRRVAVYSANGVGKTHELASDVCEFLVANKNSRVICLGPTFDQVRGGLWSEIRKCFGAARVQLSLREPGDSNWRIAEGWDASIVAVKNISAAHGRRGQRVLVIIDEAQGVENAELWDAVDSLMSSEESRTIISLNPLWPTGRAFQYCTSALWHPIRIDGFEHPNVDTPADTPSSAITEAWVAGGRNVIPGSITRRWIWEKLQEWGEDDPRWIARVRGQFPEAGDRQLIPLKLLEDTADITPDVTEPCRAGLDVARFGGDKNVLVVLDEHRKVKHVESWKDADLMVTTGRLRDAMTRFNLLAEWVGVDVCGIGAAVVDRCTEDGINVRPVDFGAAPDGLWSGTIGTDSKHLNLKAELHEVARQLFRKKLLSVPRAFRPLLWPDLTELRYDFDGSGNMRIEAKDKFRERIGRSPDYSDALIIALAATGYVPGVY